MGKIDLHSHSIASVDGEYKPKDLIDLAINSGLKYYAICDHDSVNSLKEAVNYVKDKDINFIPSIEISAQIDTTPLHILGYNINYEDIKYKLRDEYVKDSNKKYGKELIQKAKDFGFYFDENIIYNYRKDHLVCEEIVGDTILNDKRNDLDERLLPFRKGNELSDNPSFNFFKHFCTIGKPLYIPYSFNMPIKEASELIHSTNGKMFLAHPAHNIKHDLNLLHSIMDYNLDGIEVFSSYHNKQDIDFYYKQAKKNNLYMSVGSDFHGKSKPAIKLGSIDYDEDELDKTVRYILC